ncbi:hypothetical protein D0866_00792 [Hortaea werneckii]|uniref:Uncharacterized protein n=1 Tax=Hortaea werneckii TaxID=91943 RepID=A0A3M7BN31_HORWE|nr:hypothetical protein D0866_00792 [Hortaea werneckii]
MQLSLLLLSAIAGNAIAAPVLGGSVNEGKVVDSVVDPVVNTANGAVDDVLEKKRGLLIDHGYELDRRLIDGKVDVGETVDAVVAAVKETLDDALSKRDDAHPIDDIEQTADGLVADVADTVLRKRLVGGLVDAGQTVDDVVYTVKETADGALERRLVDGKVDVGNTVNGAVSTANEVVDGALERRLVDGKVDAGDTVDDAVSTAKNTVDGALQRRALGGSVPVGGTVDSVVNPTVDVANGAVDDVLERRA